MFCTTSETEGEVGPVKSGYAPLVINYWLFQGGSSIVALCCLFCDVSPYVCSFHFSSVWVAESPPFGKELLTRLTIYISLYFDYL